MARKQSKERGCPLIKKSLDKCYTSNLTDLNTVQAIGYCLENYERCEIFRDIKKNDEENES
jgi:hypothetical protein